MNYYLQTTGPTGATIYCVLVDPFGNFFNTVSKVFEAFSAADWLDYFIDVLEQSTTGVFLGTFPTTITTAGTYTAVFYRQVGSSPRVTDSNSGFSNQSIPWTGATVAIPTIPASGGGIGAIAINQNTGGTDNLRYTDAQGNGIDNATILIFQSTDYPGNPTAVIATSVTGPDGRWLNPCFVSSGTYVAVFFKVQSDGPDESAPFSV